MFDAGVSPARPRELAGAVGEVATPCTDGRPPENTPPWLGFIHQSSLPNAAKGYPPREPRARHRGPYTRATTQPRAARAALLRGGPGWVPVSGPQSFTKCGQTVSSHTTVEKRLTATKSDGAKRIYNFTTKLPRTTLGTGLARTGTNTGTPVSCKEI